jgi:flagellar motility protein MotE (MotC chaperone)
MKGSTLLKGTLLLMAAFLPGAGPVSAQSPVIEQATPEVRQAIEEYCLSISDAAAERRMATKTAALEKLEKRLEERMGRLEEEKTALEALIAKREEIRSLAKKELVDIYAGMPPEAAAAQMEKLDLRLASSVLRQMKPRQASAILSEVEPELAAQMMRVIASATQPDPEGR